MVQQPMSDRLGQVVHYMVEPLVDHPDDVTVHLIEGDASLLLELRVNPEDFESVSGPDRGVLRAMQQVIAVSSRERHVRPVLDLVEGDGSEDEE